MKVKPPSSDFSAAVRSAPDVRVPGAQGGPWKRNRTWIALAVIVAALGIAGAAFSASSIARSNAEESLHAFEHASNEIASTLQLEIERNQGLIESAAAFVTVDPEVTNAEFGRFATALRWRQRFPEVGGFGLVVPVPAADLDAFAARMEADPIEPSSEGDEFVVASAGDRPYYCLGALGQARRTFRPDVSPGHDYCAGVTAAPLQAIRDSGEALYFPLAMGELNGLAITTPVYEGAGIPGTIRERRNRFVGWLGMSVAQEQLLVRALENHPGIAATLQYSVGGRAATRFSAGEAPEDGRSTSIDLGNDWALEAVGAVASSKVRGDRGALALLAAGIAGSLLLAALVFVLGTGRARARRLVAERTGQLRHQALHDALTGLPNRELIVDRAEQLLVRNRRSGSAGAALFIDIDEFKNVNDTLGHELGDRLLIAVSARLTTALRNADTIGRLGGDEFVVLIDGGGVSAGPTLVAERLIDVMRRPFEIEGASTPLPITASIGVAIGNRSSAGELLRDADVALYEAKAAGKNRYEIFDRDMWSEASHRIELEFELRSALDDDQFRLVYQPIYDLDELSVVGAEALLRWEHPTRGTIRPGEFIPILERTGQIRELGRWVLRRACEQMVAWHARGHDLDLSVNLSGRQLESDAIIEEIGEVLNETGLEPGSLIVEVTETALMQNVEATARRLGRIKELGVRIAVDDFGTGYSSLAYLRQFPVDCLKIDRTFTEAIATSPESNALIDTLVQLGKDLGLSTLAEGIERPEQIDHLRNEHVDEGQGFLLSQPLAPEALEEQLLDPLRNASVDEAR